MNKISPIKNRILQYIECKRISKQEFCAATGISYANMKGRSLESEIGGSQIAEILSIYSEISPEWLLTGNGNMLKGEAAIAAPEDIAIRLRDKEEIILALKSVIATQEDYIAELKKGLSPRVAVAKSVAR